TIAAIAAVISTGVAAIVAAAISAIATVIAARVTAVIAAAVSAVATITAIVTAAPVVAASIPTGIGRSGRDEGTQDERGAEQQRINDARHCETSPSRVASGDR